MKYDIWPENMGTVNFFIQLENQWRVVAGMGFVSYQGLDYGAAHGALEMMGIDRAEWPELFSGLRVMEKAALAVLNAKE